MLSKANFYIKNIKPKLACTNIIFICNCYVKYLFKFFSNFFKKIFVLIIVMQLCKLNKFIKLIPHAASMSYDKFESHINGFLQS